MGYAKPRPRPNGKPKSPAKIIREAFPDMNEDRVMEMSRVIHKRLREQKEGK